MHQFLVLWNYWGLEHLKKNKLIPIFYFEIIWISIIKSIGFVMFLNLNILSTSVLDSSVCALPKNPGASNNGT